MTGLQGRGHPAGRGRVRRRDGDEMMERAEGGTHKDGLRVEPRACGEYDAGGMSLHRHFMPREDRIYLLSRHPRAGLALE
jgi:hypothetical protein